MVWDKKVAQKEAVKSFLVMLDDQINVEASVDKYRAACLVLKAQQEAEVTLVAECVGSVFDQYRGAFLNSTFIESSAVRAMVTRIPDLNTPGLYASLEAKVRSYLHDNCDQPAIPAKDDKPEQAAITGRLFRAKKGPGGGFCRNSD